ncbi:MAG TPA: hypothetical protein VEV17_09345 [Bryobacteraceae bacterium]|nr:hypothetical protein [Bryobacteraceae bacterium]
MDVHKTLRELHAERKRIDAVIASLERRLQAVSKPSAPKRRGRKSMSAEERRKVSQRMSRYWQARRAQARALQTAGA